MRYAGLLFAIPGPNFLHQPTTSIQMFVGFTRFDQFQIQQTGHMFFSTLLGTNISHPKCTFEDGFPFFARWDTLVP